MRPERFLTAGVAALVIGCGPESDPDSIRFTPDAVDASAGNLEAFLIETPAATYYLEKSGMGLSSMLDRHGNDWIGFHPAAGTVAEGEARGFPNAVHRQDGSYFHPRGEKTDPSSGRVDYAGPDRVTIIATSGNGTWEGRWDFYPTHCTFTMTSMSPGHRYWALYEGTPGGNYDDDDWWMTSHRQERTPLTVPHEGPIPSPSWIAFGDRELDRVLFVAHHQEDEHPDDFYQMHQQMTVFGFGRRRLEKFLDTVPQSFSIGFIEGVDHDVISGALRRIGAVGQ